MLIFVVGMIGDLSEHALGRWACCTSSSREGKVHIIMHKASNYGKLYSTQQTDGLMVSCLLQLL